MRAGRGRMEGGAVHLEVRNESTRKGLCRRDVLRRLAERICRGECVAGPVEVSVLFCDDAAMAALNERYRGKRGATDVLSFRQGGPGAPEGPRVLGDVVISFETVERRWGGRRDAMRAETRLLFCHGMLHLLGYDHKTGRGARIMKAKQAEYLGVAAEAAWTLAR